MNSAHHDGNWQCRIGCSGWQYRHWRDGIFYPERLPQREWLSFYASRFDTVEVNNTFYRLPETATFARWHAETPDEFLITVKASRYLTHLKRLIDPAEPIRRLFSRLRPLGSKLGPVLYQLPGSMRCDLPRLDRFLARLPRRLSRKPEAPLLRHVMEFRDPSWYVADVFALLAERGVALCLHDRAGSAIADRVVGPFVYVRFHGLSGAYHGEYGARGLSRWAAWLTEQREHGRDVFAYFNNDIGGAAPRDAQLLRALMETRGAVQSRST